MATQKQVFSEAHENIDKANHTTSGLIDYLRYIFGKLENASGGGGGSEVSYTQTLTTGSECGTITIDGDSTKIYAPTPTAPTEVEVTQVIATGTKIATISVDDVSTDIYAPAGGGSGASFTKLWENQSPTSRFSAQSIDLSSSNYDLLMIVFRMDTSRAYTKSVIIPKGGSAYLDFGYYTSADNQVTYYRTIASTDDDTLSVADASKAKNSSESSDDTICIPTYVYGITL